MRKAALALSTAAIILLPSLVAAGDSGARRGPKPNPCGAECPVRVQGEFETSIQVLPPFPSFPPGELQPVLHLLITAHGRLSHFGKATAATTDQAVDLSLNQGTGHWVFMNAKGDALWTDMDLTSTPPDVNGRTDFVFVLTVTGGAGRFAGASGTLAGVGSAQGSSGRFSIDGTVCVPQPVEEEDAD